MLVFHEQFVVLRAVLEHAMLLFKCTDVAQSILLEMPDALPPQTVLLKILSSMKGSQLRSMPFPVVPEMMLLLISAWSRTTGARCRGRSHRLPWCAPC